ncbi:hypothetical protein CBM2637_A70002 [Cupriavidus taiwanensis]|nr:hypothetical protein CBM2637_A70002 [Cupriavidus taiwanensis]
MADAAGGARRARGARGDGTRQGQPRSVRQHGAPPALAHHSALPLGHAFPRGHLGRAAARRGYRARAGAGQPAAGAAHGAFTAPGRRRLKGAEPARGPGRLNAVDAAARRHGIQNNKPGRHPLAGQALSLCPPLRPQSPYRARPFLPRPSRSRAGCAWQRPGR